MAKRHRLPAGSETTRIGVIDAAHEPVLSIASGDEVVLSTWTSWGNAITPGLTLDDILSLGSESTALGPHTLTGPIAVEGAEPGDVLRVDILELVPDDYGHNFFYPGRIAGGVLASSFADGAVRHFELDRGTMTTEVAPGLRIPLHPFLGIMGVAPAEDGPHASGTPGAFGGNLDLAALVQGTTLRLPVFRSGAGFYAGDAHACQGDGEVDQTALETAMTVAHLRFTVERDYSLERPRAETPTEVITVAVDEDLEVAARLATEDAVAVIEQLRPTDRATAYIIASLAVDLRITQMVNRRRGVHARIRKSLLGGSGR